MSLRLTWSSSSSALRCERSFTVITHARCSASTRCTAPTETTAGNAAPSRRWKRASYSPAPDAVACSNAAASSAWRSSGHHGNGVRAPSSSSRAKPGDLADAVVHVHDHPAAVGQLVGHQDAIGDRVEHAPREVALGTHAPIGLEPLGHVRQREDDTLELALRRPQGTRVLLDPAQLAVRPVDADDHARPRLPIAERQVPRLVEPVDRVARDIDERPVRVCERREHLLLRATENALHARVRRQDAPVEPEHDQALVERLDDRLVALLRTLATQLRATPLGDVRDHRIEQDPPVVPPESTAESVRPAGAARNLEPMLEIDGTTAERARRAPPRPVRDRPDGSPRARPPQARRPRPGSWPSTRTRCPSPGDDAQTAVARRARGRRHARQPTRSGARASPWRRGGRPATRAAPARARGPQAPAQQSLRRPAPRRCARQPCSRSRSQPPIRYPSSSPPARSGTPTTDATPSSDPSTSSCAKRSAWARKRLASRRSDRVQLRLQTTRQRAARSARVRPGRDRVRARPPRSAPGARRSRAARGMRRIALTARKSRRRPDPRRCPRADSRSSACSIARAALSTIARPSLSARRSRDSMPTIRAGHVRVEARSCQRLDPPDHLDVAGIELT